MPPSTLETCNNCGINPIAEGQDSPRQAGYCLDCLAKRDKYFSSFFNILEARYYGADDEGSE